MRFMPLFLAACAGSPQPVAPDIDRAGPPVQPTTLAAALESTASKILAAAVGPWLPTRVVGHAAVIHGRTACESSLGVLPMVWPSRREPVVGETWECEWTTLAVGAPTDWPAVVIASLQDTQTPPSADLTALGLQGCWLHVLLANTIWLWPGPQGSLVYRPTGDEGRVRLAWTPKDADVGRTAILQLVVLVPRDVAASGMLLSPGLSLTVGRK